MNFRGRTERRRAFFVTTAGVYEYLGKVYSACDFYIMAAKSQVMDCHGIWRLLREVGSSAGWLSSSFARHEFDQD